MRALRVLPRLVMIAALLAPGLPAVAHAQRVVLGLGSTAATDHGKQRSGLAVSLGARWGYGHVEFGPSLFADDLGSSVGRLIDPNDHSDLGTVQTGHRLTFGGDWRLEAPFATTLGWTWRGQGTWGYYRLQDDRFGIVERAVSATGWSLGLGVSHHFTRATAIGISGRYHEVGDEAQDHYVSATVDLMWLPGTAPAPRAPRTATSQDGH